MRRIAIATAVILGLVGPGAFAQTQQAPTDPGASSTDDPAPPPKAMKKAKKKKSSKKKSMAKPADGGAAE